MQTCIVFEENQTVHMSVLIVLIKKREEKEQKTFDRNNFRRMRPMFRHHFHWIEDLPKGHEDIVSSDLIVVFPL